MIKNVMYQNLVRKIAMAFTKLRFEIEDFEIESDAKCLCLSPHQDDESIGMGGTLAKYNKNFTVICLTNGSKGVESLTEEETIILRCEEFVNALSKASISDYKVLDIEDRALLENYEKFSIIDIENYDYIFIPNLIDQNNDHKSVAFHLKELLKEKPHKEDLKICMYEGWTTLVLPNKAVDIEEFIETKKAMVQSYKSQLEQRDYYTPIMGLSMYRAQKVNKKFVENFMVVSVEEFNKLVESIYSI